MSVSYSDISSTTRDKKLEIYMKQLSEELNTIRIVNENLRTYLENIQQFSKKLTNMNKTYNQLCKVNNEWIDLLFNENLNLD